LNDNPSSIGQQDLADAEEPDDRDDEVEALHQLRDAERQPELAGDDVEPGRGEDEADEDRDEGLQRMAAAEPDERGEREELDREELGRPELRGSPRPRRRPTC
jgi:hypothetical protein